MGYWIFAGRAPGETPVSADIIERCLDSKRWITVYDDCAHAHGTDRKYVFNGGTVEIIDPRPSSYSGKGILLYLSWRCDPSLLEEIVLPGIIEIADELGFRIDAEDLVLTSDNIREVVNDFSMCSGVGNSLIDDLSKRTLGSAGKN